MASVLNINIEICVEIDVENNIGESGHDDRSGDGGDCPGSRRRRTHHELIRESTH